jgi:hypothetical protein
MMHVLVTLLATSAVHTMRAAPRSAVSMSMANDLKKGLATLGFVASVGVMPAATQAVQVQFELPTTAAVALKPNVKPVDLGDEPNKLKQGFRGLGLTTGFRSKKPAAKPFKAPDSAKIFKGSFSKKA